MGEHKIYPLSGDKDAIDLDFLPADLAKLLHDNMLRMREIALKEGDITEDEGREYVTLSNSVKEAVVGWLRSDACPLPTELKAQIIAATPAKFALPGVA